MTDDQPMQLDQLLALTWGKLMMQKQYPAAASVAILSYFLAREGQDENRRRGSLSILFKSIEELRSAEGGGETGPGKLSASCSFCGRCEPEVKLAAGVDSFICNSCVETFHDLFEKGRGQ